MALKDGYLNKITSEHKIRPKYMATVAMLLDYTDPSMEICLGMHSAFDVDTAVGVQLDVLGQYLGKPRNILYTFEGGESSILSDEIYRVLIKATIIKNNWRGGISDLYDAWLQLFPNIKISIRDNQDMTMDVTLVGEIHPQIVSLVEHGYIIPKPQGVKVNMQINNNPIFAYESDTDELAGYDKGEWK